MADDQKRGVDRREFLKTTLAASALLPVAGAALGAFAAHAEDEQLVTDIQDPAVSAMVTTLQYTNESAKPDQKCADCQLYTAASDAAGKCQLFTRGQVAANGWCMSWVKKVG